MTNRRRQLPIKIGLLLSVLLAQTWASVFAFDSTMGLPACKEAWQSNPHTERKSCYKVWTVLVYMNGDNDLSAHSIRDITEMEKVGSSDQVDFVVQHDTSQPDGVRRYHIEKNSGEVLDHKVHSNVLENLPEQDSGNWETLKDFLFWGFQAFPAQHHMVIIWSHGKGFSGGISTDYTSNSSISIPQLKAAIRFSRTYVLLDKQIDIYASDACLMQSLEVIYEVGSEARFIVGSANLEDKNGWPYQAVFQDLVDNPTLQPYRQLGNGMDAAYRFAANIPDIYIRSYQDNDLDATMSAVNTNEITAEINGNITHGNIKIGFLDTLTRLSEDLNRFIQEDTFINPMLLVAAFNNAPKFGDESRDIYYFTAYLLTLLKTQSVDSLTIQKLQSSLAQTQGWIRRILLSGASNPGKTAIRAFSQEFQRLPFKGLTLWMPADASEYTRGKPFYSQSELLQRIGWLDLLEQTYAPREFGF